MWLKYVIHPFPPIPPFLFIKDGHTIFTLKVKGVDKLWITLVNEIKYPYNKGVRGQGALGYAST